METLSNLASRSGFFTSNDADMIKIGGAKKKSSALLAYPGLGYPAGNRWRLEVGGVAWRTPIVFNRRQKMMIRMLGGVMHASPDEMQGEVFRTRITPFMASAGKRKAIIVSVLGKSFRLEKKTKRNGHFKGRIEVDREIVEAAKVESNMADMLPYEVGFEDDSVEPVRGWIHLYQRDGISVVSDIDDTIKHSEVKDKRKLLANTFLREFRSVPGMSDVYQNWAASGASFHYVSSSPWQLFESLSEMNEEFSFPNGTMHLRNFRLRDQFLKKVLIRQKGKASTIRGLMKFMPERDFVLIGDSGEKDPKIYSKVCRKFPGRVKGVFIRELKANPMKAKSFRKLKSNLPQGLCSRFTDAKELAELTHEIFAGKQ